MNNFYNRTLFSSGFSVELARSTIAAVSEREYREWLSEMENYPDDGDLEAVRGIDILSAEADRHRQMPAVRQLGTITGPPIAENMTSAQIEQMYAAGDDPWAQCNDAEKVCDDAHPTSATIVSLIGICASFPDERAFEQMFRPGGITLLICASSGTRKLVAQALNDAAGIWKKGLAAVSEREIDIHAFETEPGAAHRYSHNKPESFSSAIDNSLRQRRGVLVVCNQVKQLSTEHQSMVRQTLYYPQISAEMIVETLKWTHSWTGKVAELELIKRLPDAEMLRRLAPLQLEVALSESSTFRVVDRLTEIATAEIGPTAVTLDDVLGLDDVLTPVKQMLNDINEWRAGRADWSDLTRSCLFFGPPGVGKTLLASAIAGSAGLPIISTSYSDCQKNGHQGDMLAALANAFERAAQAAPAVLFIDELDSFSNRANGKGNEQYMRGIVNGLLEQINFANKVEGLILLGATNHIHSIDPAVIRSGRFDVKLEVGHPSVTGLEAILRAKLGKNCNRDLNLKFIAERLLGQSGATAEALVRDALGRARSERSELKQGHLNLAADQLAPSLVNTTLLDRIAFHEAGHLLASLLLLLPTPKRAWISPRGGNVEPGELRIFTPSLAKAQMQVLLAGRAAEALHLEEVSSGAGVGPDSDLAQATRLAMAFEIGWGFGESGLTWQNIDLDKLFTQPTKVQQRVERHLNEAYSAVSRLLSQNSECLEELANRLKAQRELRHQEIEEIRRNLPGPCEAPVFSSSEMRPAI